MIVLPKITHETRIPRHEKPLFYFKNVTLGSKGFEFADPTEFDIDDGFPLTSRMSNRGSRITAINDIFYVAVSISKHIVTIYLRDNIKYMNNTNEIPNLLSKPCYLPTDCFENEDTAGLYKFCKIVENEFVKIRFNGYVSKVLLNGDQIIFALKNHVVIYTLFASSVIKAKPIDIAVNGYLYILTKNEVLVYGESLYKKMEISMKCRYIIPTSTPSTFFLIRKSQIYRVVDGHAELYFEAVAAIYSYTFDERYMYITTCFSMYKIGLYDKETTGIQLKSKHLKIYQCDGYVVLYNSSSGVLVVDKNDFSKFCPRNLYNGVSSVATYKNTIAYYGANTIYFFEFTERDGDLVPEIKASTYKVGKMDVITPEEFCELVDGGFGGQPYTRYGITAITRPQKQLGIVLDPKIQRMATAVSKMYEVATNSSDPYAALIAEVADDPIKIPEPREGLISDQEDQMSHVECHRQVDGLIPSPKMTQDEMPALRRCGDMTKLEEVELVGGLIAPKFPGITAKCVERTCRVMKRIGKMVARAGLMEELSSSVEDEKLFGKPVAITNPVLLAVPKFKRGRARVKDACKIVDVCSAVQARYGLRHPATFSTPLESFNKTSVLAIEVSRKRMSYTKSMFFVKNHMDFYADRYRPKSMAEPQRPCSGTICRFIDDEFKRIVGYRQDANQVEMKQEITVKKRRGGF